MKNQTHIFWHQTTVTKPDREKQSSQKGAVIWLTGLSGSGKSTLANCVEAALFAAGYQTYLLDGDNIRNGLNRDLSFSEEDRRENIRRISEVAKLFADSNSIVLTAFISPYRADRSAARKKFESDEFIEVYVKCSLAVCESRDPKGLYKKARSGIIPSFTGIDSPYEPPESPELIVDTEQQDLETCTNQVIQYLKDKNIIR
ncbi:adenylyl-sulfate kinase [Sporolactobacillus sp. CPB3-1]|uniref:Adenylyl-sulfate kinase n=1 Tax=Sporolactobacillus mangiferae TaxID=2940498 RepID=A0ABT0M8R1_9BACL|nr:adenylyl-sulfate kinase [Sporolactobacillus mangiferae]MCL1631257.1 adenylyl-sulfate kinase [Sporolactobacillus mangiferae]